MCRYGFHNYSPQHVCFDCRKGFTQSRERVPDTGKRAPRTVATCPECGGPMTNMGFDFAIPPRRDLKQWQKVRLLAEHQVFFNGCGCGGPGYRPRTYGEARRTIDRFVDHSPQVELLRKFEAKARRS